MNSGILTNRKWIYRHMTVLPRVFVICSLTLVEVGRTFFLSESYLILFYFPLFSFIFLYFPLFSFILFHFINLFFIIFYISLFFFFSLLFIFFFHFIQFNAIAEYGIVQLSFPLFVSSSVCTA